MRAHIASALAKIRQGPVLTAEVWRRFEPGSTRPASFLRHRALRQTDRGAEWQVSSGFREGPVDWPGAETAENRSPEANSLQTS